MPIPFIPALLGLVGAGTIIHGASKMKDAKDTIKVSQSLHKQNMNKLEKENIATSKEMDKLGILELEILNSFGDFSDVFEQIKNRPEFQEYAKNGFELPKYNGEKLREVSIGADALLAGLGSAALGTAGGFVAKGVVAAVTAWTGTASTGIRMASLNGAALTNAVLASLGGGSLAAGGGGIAAGSLFLGGATLGVGLLVGGIIFSFAGGKLSDKADEAWSQMKRAETKINEICDYLMKLTVISKAYYRTLLKVNDVYQEHLDNLKTIVNTFGHKDWNTFTDAEKEITENTVLLVGLLYNMCKVELVRKAEKEDDLNSVNREEVLRTIKNAKDVLSDKFQSAMV